MTKVLRVPKAISTGSGCEPQQSGLSHAAAAAFRDATPRGMRIQVDCYREQSRIRESGQREDIRTSFGAQPVHERSGDLRHGSPERAYWIGGR